MTIVRCACLLLFAATTSLQPGPFRANSPDYSVTSAGSVVENEGASVTLSAHEKPKRPGTAMAEVEATPARMQRVTFSGELRTSAAEGGAFFWMRVDSGKRTLFISYGTQKAAHGDTDWTPRTVTVAVPSDATKVVLGVMLQPGGGSAEARHLRLTVSPLPTTPPSDAAAKLLDEALSIVRKNALHAKDVDWAAREPEIRAFAAGAQKPSDVYNAIEYVLALLNDGHSFFSPPALTKAYASGGAENPAAEVRAANGIGTIVVPTYAGLDPSSARAYATHMFGALQQAAPAARCGWIVDLRTNGGGNMHPMLNGLEPLLGKETLGSFVTASGKKEEWGATGPATPPRDLMKLGTASVAVITGPHTASSGEIVAIAFRGRPHTRSFGQPTAGLTTANDIFKLSDGSSLVLTISVDADRTGQVYGGKLEPDEVVDDATVVDVASKWLRDSSGCGGQ